LNAVAFDLKTVDFVADHSGGLSNGVWQEIAGSHFKGLPLALEHGMNDE
jgi:hypothetical protein